VKPLAQDIDRFLACNFATKPEWKHQMQRAVGVEKTATQGSSPT